jgi:hypothetical protein
VPVVPVEPVDWVVILQMDLLDPQFQVIKICIQDILVERDLRHIPQARVRPKRNQFRS